MLDSNHIHWHVNIDSPTYFAPCHYIVFLCLTPQWGGVSVGISRLPTPSSTKVLRAPLAQPSPWGRSLLQTALPSSSCRTWLVRWTRPYLAPPPLKRPPPPPPLLQWVQHQQIPPVIIQSACQRKNHRDTKKRLAVMRNRSERGRSHWQNLLSKEWHENDQHFLLREKTLGYKC